MNFKKYLKLTYSTEHISLLALINVILLIVIFFMFLFPFTVQSGIDIFFPRVITSDMIKQENFIITITGENLVYLNGQITTLKELHQKLSKYQNKDRSVLIKAEHRTSLGRIVDVWDLCRNSGIEKINLATKQEDQ
jgi:biopolymer transport protein ExbD